MHHALQDSLLCLSARVAAGCGEADRTLTMRSMCGLLASISRHSFGGGDFRPLVQQ